MKVLNLQGLNRKNLFTILVAHKYVLGKIGPFDLFKIGGHGGTVWVEARKCFFVFVFLHIGTSTAPFSDVVGLGEPSCELYSCHAQSSGFFGARVNKHLYFTIETGVGQLQ